jgi:hypothetical protein
MKSSLKAGYKENQYISTLLYEISSTGVKNKKKICCTGFAWLGMLARRFNIGIITLLPKVFQAKKTQKFRS